jgi:hypothetical protein
MWFRSLALTAVVVAALTACGNGGGSTADGGGSSSLPGATNGPYACNRSSGGECYCSPADGGSPTGSCSPESIGSSAVHCCEARADSGTAMLVGGHCRCQADATSCFKTAGGVCGCGVGAQTTYAGGGAGVAEVASCTASAGAPCCWDSTGGSCVCAPGIVCSQQGATSVATCEPANGAVICDSDETRVASCQ